MAQDVHLPAGDPRAVAVVLHPHPGMGGDRHHPLVVAVAEGLAARGVAALRIDLTDPEPSTSAAALTVAAGALAAEVGVRDIVLVGYSWGSVVSTLAQPDGLVARCLVAPPTSLLVPGEGDGTPTLVLVPAHDQYGGPEAVRDLMGTWPATTIEVVEGADHFLAGAVARIAERAVGWVEAQLGG
jgi:alpha/beta superfamily hydrolase